MARLGGEQVQSHSNPSEAGTSDHRRSDERSIARLHSTEVGDFHELSREELRRTDRPAPRVPIDAPFDIERAIVAFSEGLESESSGVGSFSGWPTDETFASPLGRQEAHFWFMAATQPERLTGSARRSACVDLLRVMRFDGDISIADARARLDRFCRLPDVSLRAHYPLLGRVLEALLGTTASLQVMLGTLPPAILLHLVEGIGWPDPGDPELDPLLRQVERIVDGLQVRTSHDGLPAAKLLARLPHQPSVFHLITVLRTFRTKPTPDAHLDLLLHELEDVGAYKKALRASTRSMRFHDPTRVILRTVERSEFAELRDLVQVRVGQRNIGVRCFSVWSRVHTRHLVPMMLAFSSVPGIGEQANAWLLAEGANAIVELLEIATQKSPLRDSAREYLVRYVERGHGGLVARLLAQQPERIRTIINALLELDERSLRRTSERAQGIASRPALIALRKPSAPTSQPTAPMASDVWPSWIEHVFDASQSPSWLSSAPEWRSRSGERVPPLVERALRSILERGLPFDPEREHTLFSRFDDRLPELVSLLDPLASRIVGLELLRAYFRGGGRKTDRWALRAFLLFPSQEGLDLIASHLSGRKRCSRSDAEKAYVAKLVSLCDVEGTWELMGTLERSHVPGVKAVATDWLQKRATMAGAELPAFRLLTIPRCGLDSFGRCSFDVGNDVYKGRLMDLNEFEVLDPAGHKIQGIPCARKGASYLRREHMRERLAQIRQQLAHVFAVLEDARAGLLSTSWSLDLWRKTFLDHPVLFHFARNSLWQATSAPCETTVFRVAEDRTIADINDDTVPFESINGATLRMLSAHDLEPEALLQWVELLSNYRQIGAIESLQAA